MPPPLRVTVPAGDAEAIRSAARSHERAASALAGLRRSLHGTLAGTGAAWRGPLGSVFAAAGAGVEGALARAADAFADAAGALRAYVVALEEAQEMGRAAARRAERVNEEAARLDREIAAGSGGPAEIARLIGRAADLRIEARRAAAMGEQAQDLARSAARRGAAALEALAAAARSSRREPRPRDHDRPGMCGVPGSGGGPTSELVAQCLTVGVGRRLVLGADGLPHLLPLPKPDVHEARRGRRRGAGRGGPAGPGTGRPSKRVREVVVQVLEEAATRVGRVERNALSDKEFATAQKVVRLRGGMFRGQPEDNYRGIDGWRDGVPVSLKRSVRSRTQLIEEFAKDAEGKAATAQFRGVELYIEAPRLRSTGVRSLLARSEEVRAILRRGTISEIHVLARGGLVSARIGAG